MREQKFINENLCPLNCLGKWIWHGGFTETQNYNPFSETQFRMSAFDRATKIGPEVLKWAKEVINTSPDNLQLSMFDDDSGAISVKQSGIYEVSFVFFIPCEVGSPSVQIRIDHQPILSTIDQKQTIIYHQDSER